jgi:hypothetical protein
MPQGFSLPQDMLYQAPEIVQDGSINWVQTPPLDRSSFTQDQSFKIRIGSLTDFLLPQRSYLKFDLKFTNSTGGSVATSATSYLTSLGGASVFRSITTTCAGREVERIDNYNAFVSTIYKRLPTTAKNFLLQAELYGHTGASSLNHNADTVANGRTIYHPLRTALFENDKMICLPFLRGGVELDIQLESIVRVASDATPIGYSISNIQFVGCYLRPNASYLQQFNSKLSSGQKAQVPLQVVRNIRISPSATTQQETPINLGFFKSLKQVMSINRSASTLSTQGTDSFAVDTLDKLKSYYWRVGSERYPKNFAIECNNLVSTGAVKIEQQMMALCSLDNTYAHYNSTGFSDTDSYQFYNWASNSSFGSGIPVEDGVINFAHEYSSAPTATDVYDMWFFVDGVLSISFEDVSMDFKDI